MISIEKDIQDLNPPTPNYWLEREENKERVLRVPRKMAFLAKYSRIWQPGMILQLLVMYFTRGFLRVSLLAS